MSVPTPKEQFESGITVKRYAAATLIKGVYQAVTPTTFTITASIQPASGDEVMTLPEGDREKELLAVFTNTALRTIDQDTKTEADRITWEGSDYEVIKVSPWKMGALDHYECIVARVNP